MVKGQADLDDNASPVVPGAAAGLPFSRELITRQRGNVPLYQQVMDAARSYILNDDLENEDALPNESSLVELFGVSRGTLRQAMEGLESEGLIARVPGRGTFVNSAERLRRFVWSRLRDVALPDSRFDFDFTEFVPDFVGSSAAIDRVRRTREYRTASRLFVTPDNNLERLRRVALEDGKQVVVATFGLRRGFVVLDAGQLDPNRYEIAATLDGMERLGRRLSLAKLEAEPPVDLVLTGAAAITSEGVHVGKGHGYFDLEWAILATLGRVTQQTPVITVVHDCQVVTAAVRAHPHDVPVDLIATPTRLTRIQQSIPKPSGVNWATMSSDHQRHISLLEELAARHGV